jgi:hypothetical protein
MYRFKFYSLTRALIGGEWPVSFPVSLPPGKSPPPPVGPRAGLDQTERWEFLTLPGLELLPLGRPARSQAL